MWSMRKQNASMLVEDILLRAKKGARNPNLNVAFTNACAAVVWFGPDSILLKS